MADGPATSRDDPQALFASESLAQALRQLEVYGRDGLPVISADGRRVEGWITSATVLRALARQITGTRTAAAEAQAAADGDCREEAEALPHPPTPLAGYEVAEITVTAARPSPGGNCTRSRGRRPAFPCHCCADVRLGPPDPGITLAEGDRVGLLIPTPPGPQHRR